ncbi:DUF5327 family protein [Alkalibacillus silvisoli]|uniref:YwdI family protein n=1 Tax=Alkalibacillus silvisoli TaxID=392823 RepID=A0ABN0ZYA9_9BACI
MTISYGAIIEKMKNELQSIEQSTNEADIHAKMYAIRSLADVVLTSDERRATTLDSNDQSHFKEHNQSDLEVSDIEARMMGIQKPEKKSFDKGTRLEEDDTNGDSIFDF